MMDGTKLLREEYTEYTIETPENVTFGYEIAGIGSRFIGALIDTTILVVALGLLNILVIVLINLLAGGDDLQVELESSEPAWVEGVVIALYALFNFALLWGYYILFELLLNGQSPGKRLAKLRVVRLDGGPIGFGEAAVRNLVRIIDFLPVGYGVGLVTMFCNRQTRRLGDLAAGTLVVKHQSDIRLATLTGPPQVTPVTMPATGGELLLPAWANAQRLDAADYELVQTTLARYRAGLLNPPLLARVAAAIATKMGPPPSSHNDYRSSNDGQGDSIQADLDLLRAVAEVYRRQAH
jgi:uncharacterized RDD family membrane protein YckC